MRKARIFLVLCAIAVALLLALQPYWVQPPAKNGTGPLAIKMDARLVAPEYHSPIVWWRTHHMDLINGGDFAETGCLHCHEVKTSCNNCHDYVGVRAIANPSP